MCLKFQINDETTNNLIIEKKNKTNSIQLSIININYDELNNKKKYFHCNCVNFAEKKCHQILHYYHQALRPIHHQHLHHYRRQPK